MLRLGLATIVALTATPAIAQGPLEGLIGSWSGSGSMQFGAQPERLGCKAVYREGSGGVQLNLQCASSSSDRVTATASLRASGARNVIGSWRVLSPMDQSGTLFGLRIGSSLELALRGNIEGTMKISVGASQQKVTVKSESFSMQGIFGKRVAKK